MCGIFGIIGEEVNRSAESTFLSCLGHRGPDDHGAYTDSVNNVLLGQTRLAIIDLSNRAHQPMIANDNFVIVFNGEIYNYKELRKELMALGHSFNTQSDTEVILRSYIQWKEDALPKLRGMFAFIIYDKINKTLFLARDRFGIKPLIYSFHDSKLFLSSELHPFFKSGVIPIEIDYLSIQDYFRFGSVSQPKTILKGAQQLKPSHFMSVNITDLSYEIKKYYDLSEEIVNRKQNLTYNDAVKATRSALEDATLNHLVADVEVGAFLSGGVDSSAVVGLMKNYVNVPINTFSVGFKVRTEVDDELSVAKNTAKHLGTRHHEVVLDDMYVLNIFDQFIDSLDQPSIDGINTFIVSKEARSRVKVALSGLGGDEIFAGYQHFVTIMKGVLRKRSIFTWMGERLDEIRPNKFTRSMRFAGLNSEEGVAIRRSIHKSPSEVLLASNGNFDIEPQPKYLSNLQRISKAELDNYLLNTLLRDNDVLSMANSMEVRPILLDHKLVELAISLPDEFKIRNGLKKSVFVDAVNDIIPQETYKRRKTGFEMPFVYWMNGILNQRVQKTLDFAGKFEILQPKTLQELKHRAQNAKLIRKDWIYFIFFAWLEGRGLTNENIAYSRG